MKKISGIEELETPDNPATAKNKSDSLLDSVDRAEHFLFAVSLMPHVGPDVRNEASKHHEALRDATKRSKR